MKEQFQKRIDTVKEKWNSLEKVQKTKLIITAIILIGVLGVFLYLSLRPNYEVLTSGLTLEQVGEAQTILDDAGIYNEPTDDGVIVYSEDKQEAEILLASSDISTVGEFTYEDALDASGMGTTSSIKRQNMINAQQTYIANGLELMDGVDNAVVTLSIPETSDFFISDTPDTSASVILTTSREISDQEALSMARYVAGSVVDLETANITITDQNMDMVFSGEEMDQNSYYYLYDQELQRKSDIEGRIRSQLIPLYDDVEVNTNLVLDNTNSSQYREEYDNPYDPDSATGFVDIEGSEEQSVTGGTTAGEPGLSSNDGGINTYETDDGTESSADLAREDSEYIYNVTRTQSDIPGGGIVQEDSSISLVVYNYKVYDETVVEESGILEEQNMTWNQYKNTLEQTPLEIDDGLVQTIQMGTGIENISIIGYEVPRVIDAVEVPVNIQQIVMYIVLALLILLLAIGLIRNTQREEIEEIEPELTVEDLLVSTQIEEEEELEKLKSIEFNKENQVKQQIEEFINEKPEAVAQLLRNWLSDDWE